jgi:hypothetical protein
VEPTKRAGQKDGVLKYDTEENIDDDLDQQDCNNPRMRICFSEINQSSGDLTPPGCSPRADTNHLSPNINKLPDELK